jgi:hypothetical protein
VGVECGTNKVNINTYRNLIATLKRNSILEVLLVYEMIILKYILKRREIHELDSSISGNGRVVCFCVNVQETYDFINNNEFLDQ